MATLEELRAERKTIQARIKRQAGHGASAPDPSEHKRLREIDLMIQSQEIEQNINESIPDR